jgi:hypothetical protein
MRRARRAAGDSSSSAASLENADSDEPGDARPLPLFKSGARFGPLGLTAGNLLAFLAAVAARF